MHLSRAEGADKLAVCPRFVDARDYALLLGMPGTGKSSTIVQAVIALSAAGRSVVLMSYTNRRALSECIG